MHKHSPQTVFIKQNHDKAYGLSLFILPQTSGDSVVRIIISHPRKRPKKHIFLKNVI